MNSFKDYNIILINIDGFRKDKIDYCPALKSLKEIANPLAKIGLIYKLTVQ